MCTEVSVVVLDWDQAIDETAAAIASRTGFLPGATVPVVLALRGAVADCADANAQKGLRDHASLSRTDIERLVQRTVELIDRDALEQAVTSGICGPVDFRSDDVSHGFYAGLDVQPGHVGAGLVQPRPALTGDVVDSLMHSRSVLVTGPSGVGKSAVLWSTVHVTRYVLWYRVRRLYEEDVEPLPRLARAAGVSPRTPVGFVVDAVGRADVQAWDAVQRQVRALPGLYLLGTARHEDLRVSRGRRSRRPAGPGSTPGGRSSFRRPSPGCSSEAGATQRTCSTPPDRRTGSAQPTIIADPGQRRAENRPTTRRTGLFPHLHGRHTHSVQVRQPRRTARKKARTVP